MKWKNAKATIIHLKGNINNKIQLIESHILPINVWMLREKINWRKKANAMFTQTQPVLGKKLRIEVRKKTRINDKRLTSCMKTTTNMKTSFKIDFQILICMHPHIQNCWNKESKKIDSSHISLNIFGLQPDVHCLGHIPSHANTYASILGDPAIVVPRGLKQNTPDPIHKFPIT